LTAYGLLASDSEVASDHLPVVYDLFDGSTVAVAEPPAPTPLQDRLRVTPNPAAAGAAVWIAIDATLAPDGIADLFDVSGRHVRRLSAPVAGAEGGSAFVWDGRDETGRAAASGVYYVRVHGLGASGEPIVARARLGVIG
jgi:hypothetical protein